jgi:hypothetical protein
MSFLRELIASKAQKDGFEFGVHKNVRLVKADNTPRYKDSELLNQNTFLTFKKYSDDGKVLAEQEFKFFGIDVDKDYAVNQLASQVSILQNIQDVMLGEYKEIDPFVGLVGNSLEEIFANPSTIEKAIINLFDAFEENLRHLIGEKGPLFSLKTVYSNNGKWIQLPGNAPVVSSNDNQETLVFSARELKGKEASENNAGSTAAPDAVGSAPTTKTSLLSSL